jgi:hypothetical protein
MKSRPRVEFESSVVELSLGGCDFEWLSSSLLESPSGMAGAAAVGYTGPATVIVDPPAPATAETRNLMKDSSHAQRLEEWFALYAESLPQDAGVAKLPKGQLPWSDTIVEKTPVLRSLMGWALRYGFKRDQLKRKLQDWKPGVKIKLNDHTTAIASFEAEAVGRPGPAGANRSCRRTMFGHFDPLCARLARRISLCAFPQNPR